MPCPLPKVRDIKDSMQAAIDTAAPESQISLVRSPSDRASNFMHPIIGKTSTSAGRPRSSGVFSHLLDPPRSIQQ